MLQELKFLKRVDFSAGEVKSVEMPRVFVSKKYQLRLKLTLVALSLASGQTYGSNVTDAPATILRRIDLRVVSDKSQNIKSVSGRDLLKMANYDLRGTQENQNNIPEGTSSDAGIKYCYGSYDLNFEAPDAAEMAFNEVDNAGNLVAIPTPYRPKSLTLFDPTKFNPVEIVITWGTIANLQTGYTAGVLTLSSGYVRILSTELPDIKGDFMMNRQMYKETTIEAESTDMRIDLPKGNLIRKIFIEAIDDGVFDNSIINNVKIIVNENVTKVDAGFNELRNENAKQYGIPFSSLLTGCAVIDFDANGDFKGLLDVTLVDSVRLSLDVNSPTGTSKIRIVVQEITP